MWTQPRPQGEAVSVEGIWTLFIISLLQNLLPVELAPCDPSRHFYLPAVSISVFRVRVFRTRKKKKNPLALLTPPAMITPRPPSGSPSASDLFCFLFLPCYKPLAQKHHYHCVEEVPFPTTKWLKNTNWVYYWRQNDLEVSKYWLVDRLLRNHIGGVP